MQLSVATLSKDQLLTLLSHEIRTDLGTAASGRTWQHHWLALVTERQVVRCTIIHRVICAVHRGAGVKVQAPQRMVGILVGTYPAVVGRGVKVVTWRAAARP